MTAIAEQLSAQRARIERELVAIEAEVAALDPEDDGQLAEQLLDRLERLRRQLALYGTASPP